MNNLGMAGSFWGLPSMGVISLDLILDVCIILSWNDWWVF